jgi:hypothetical protein
VKAETVKKVFADIECQGADHDPQQEKRPGAGDKSGDQRRQPKHEPDIRAMAQEG